MKTIFVLFALVVAAAATGTPARAQNYPWCAIYNAGDNGSNCGFTSFPQCMATVSGIGGFCERNNTYVPPGGPARRRAK